MSGIMLHMLSLLHTVCFWLVVSLVTAVLVRRCSGDRDWWAGPYLMVPTCVRTCLASALAARMAFLVYVPPGGKKPNERLFCE